MRPRDRHFGQEDCAAAGAGMSDDIHIRAATMQSLLLPAGGAHRLHRPAPPVGNDSRASPIVLDHGFASTHAINLGLTPAWVKTLTEAGPARSSATRTTAARPEDKLYDDEAYATQTMRAGTWQTMLGPSSASIAPMRWDIDGRRATPRSWRCRAPGRPAFGGRGRIVQPSVDWRRTAARHRRLQMEKAPSPDRPNRPDLAAHVTRPSQRQTQRKQTFARWEACIRGSRRGRCASGRGRPRSPRRVLVLPSATQANGPPAIHTRSAVPVSQWRGHSKHPDSGSQSCGRRQAVHKQRGVLAFLQITA